MNEPASLWDAIDAFADQLWIAHERWPVVRSGPRTLIPRDVRVAVYKRDRFRCSFCGETWNLTLDHIVPWSAGGSDDPSNLRTLCRDCNERRSNYRYCGDVSPRRNPLAEEEAS